MKFLIFVICLFFAVTNLQAASDTSRTNAERSRSDALDSAHKANLAAKKAFEEAGRALELSAKDDLKNVGQDLKIALLKVEKATKRAELKTDQAYKGAIASGKVSALKAFQEARNAVEAAKVALQKTNASIRFDLQSDDQALAVITAETRQAFKDLEQKTKQTVLATENSLEETKKELSYFTKNAEEFTAEEKTNIQQAYGREIVKMDSEISKIKNRLKSKTESTQKKFSLQMDALDAKRSDVQIKFNQLSDNSSFAWNDLKKGMDDAVKDIRVSLRHVKKDIQRE